MKYFKVYELVDKLTYTKYRDSSIRFLDNRLLETLDIIRDILGVPMVINDWYWGGNNQQRGLRTNLCQIVVAKSKSNTLYLSNHCFGRAIDAVSAKMTADEMRKKIVLNAHKLPYPIRLEAGVSWLHFDLNMLPNVPKITMFS